MDFGQILTKLVFFVSKILGTGQKKLGTNLLFFLSYLNFFRYVSLKKYWCVLQLPIFEVSIQNEKEKICQPVRPALPRWVVRIVWVGQTGASVVLTNRAMNRTFQGTYK